MIIKVELPEYQTTKYWKPRQNSTPHLQLSTLAKFLLADGFSRDSFYLTESRKHVPMLIIKGEKLWCSVSYFKNGDFFRLFTNYLPNGIKLSKEIPVVKYLRVQKRHTFRSIKKISEFIVNEDWMKYETTTDVDYFIH